MKEELDISELPEIEISMYSEDTWCNKCGKADLGISNLTLYLENGSKYISGNCNACNELCTSEIIVKNATE